MQVLHCKRQHHTMQNWNTIYRIIVQKAQTCLISRVTRLVSGGRPRSSDWDFHRFSIVDVVQALISDILRRMGSQNLQDITVYPYNVVLKLKVI